MEIGGARVPLIVLWLIAAGLFFTFYLGGINFRGFAEGLRIVGGKGKQDTQKGEISPYAALSTAISGTVGIGNIGGVAIALSVGGPGATFWMIVAGLLGMATKCAECVLSVRYRSENEDGSVSGGPMYSLSRGLALRGYHGLGRGLGSFYALAMVFGCLGIGNMFQSNQAYQQFVVVTGGDASFFEDQAGLFGILLALAVALVILGGIRSIARVAERLVPAMAALYLLGGLAIIALNAPALPGALAAIVRGAFSPEGISGGVVGAMIIGFQRAAFSNEAGLGSAAIAHSAVRTHHPATEGLVALLEPFIDTVVICTVTALVILTTIYEPGLADRGLEGVEITSAAFGSTITGSPLVVAIAALLFAFTTIISWSYYGLKGWTYLVGEHPVAVRGFQIVFCFFIVLGCLLELDAVLSLSDTLIFIVALPNVIGLYIMAPEIRALLEEYLSQNTPPSS
ncbi:MAG: alanine:cation symporter family protein [Planctomycetaceae bacterium]|nr:alanine:cation symporter family protein [Planctomycetaceae bacterium]